MDCSCEHGSSIDIVKIMVSYLAHIINVFHASINTRDVEQVNMDE